MKTVVSIPNRIFESAEKLAKQLDISRSQLYTDAVGALIEKHHNFGVTEQLNFVYETNPGASRLDPEIVILQAQSLSDVAKI